ncbi:hypothetical protein DICPUDRAFT_49160 [Dictyostelium purpureum]|uniref:Glucosidase II subunit alpha n=1 Tax=Dictyostelium purpureum TaxID=5786 RepID=F0ZSI1_DICPU|nr:uncharacterized protein DICPUDRAFT_49160 [Dictyostelium purpureum]EGC33095.1 hypothetical protein DICPUDRAFT_49160 [Dictyostelium purpureum]|eukprot:XP_003290372.1 hypothetical protein DICPUDRAFT_49160 [Dictyostelium purpureum]
MYFKKFNLKSVLLILVLISLIIIPILSVDSSKFKTCQESHFCKRQRQTHEGEINPMKSFQTFNVIRDTVKLNQNDKTITFDLQEKTAKDNVLTMKLELYENGIVRMRAQEKSPLANKKRYHVNDVLLDSIKTQSIKWKEEPKSSSNHFSFIHGEKQCCYVQVQLEPFKLDVYIMGELAITTNKDGLFHFEPIQEKPTIAGPENKEGNTEENNNNNNNNNNVAHEGYWEERFQSHQDSKPNGPMSIGMDFTFVGSSHVYGIPEHSTRLSLKSTTGNGIKENPYRLYNLDVFEYEIDKTMALYGSVPLMISHDTKKTTAIFWLNAAETFVDIEDVEGPSKKTHWISETGILDVFYLTGPTPSSIFKQYAYLTGTTQLPQMFSLGYHQCKWNYKSEDHVKEIDAGFDKHQIPYDVIWLDIEHTDGKRYFTWDNNNFPTPEEMLKAIAVKNRKMVNIVDPHIKRDNGYYIHSEAQSKGYYIKNKDGNDYDGWCWPGSSSYLDFTNPEIRDWWASQFAYDKYKGSAPNLYIWNDMNEPSVFNGPEVSMHKDAKHWGDYEHRDLHNLYGFYYHMASADGLIKRNPDQNDRPFVLSRAFFAGSQRIGAIWTGDNAAEWSHLDIANPMLLSLNIAGITFSGADVGGFFGNPDAELLARWYQAGAFQPFFRGHAHLDSRHREPWLFDEPYSSVMKDAIITRYTYLPLWYTTFFENTINGSPVINPLWVQYPKEQELFDIDDTIIISNSLLVKPVTKQGAKSMKVILPGKSVNEIWYDVDTEKPIEAGTYEIDTPLEKIPVYQRGGSIIPKKERVRRSSAQMKDDPFTIRIALDKNQFAQGQLYIDDEHSFDYKKGNYLYKQFTFKDNTLIFNTHPESKQNGKFTSPSTIEKIIILGYKQKPTSIVSEDGKQLSFDYDQSLSKLTIRKPDFSVNSNFILKFN